MKLNELVCPTCGLKCLTEDAYTTCASCQTMFYAVQSRTVRQCPPMITITWPQPYVQPVIEGAIWVVPYGPITSPYGPTTTCAVSTGATTGPQSDGYQTWN